MEDNKKYVKKIRLNNGAVYYFYDEEAPRKLDLENYLPLSGGTITGNLTVDQELRAGKILIDSIEYISSTTDDILVIDANGNIRRRGIDNLLEDIGGCSYNMDDSTGVLSFKVGRQPKEN